MGISIHSSTETVVCSVIRRSQTANGNCNWNLVLPVPYLRAWQDMSLSVSPSAWGAVSRFAPRMPLLKLRPDHTADEQVEAVVELTQSALDSLGLKPGMIKPL